MGDLSLIIFTTSSKDGAAQALEVAKGLDRDGWIELMDYALARKDEKGNVTVQEMDDELSEKVAAAAVGVSGAVVGAVLGGPAGAATGLAAGALTGAGSMRLTNLLVQDKSLGGFSQDLAVDSSVLAVVLEERYAERLDEEFQKLGRTVRKELKRAERDAEFDAYLLRSKARIRTIQDDINAQVTKAQVATAAERIKIEADVALRGAELEARSEKLENHIKAMNTDLRSDIREMNFRLEQAGLSAKSGIAAGIDHLQRQLNHYNDELENLVQDRIDTLRTEAADLKARAAKASGETKAAIETHLLAVEVSVRKERVALHDNFEERLLQLKQWCDNLRVRSALTQAEVRDKLQASVNAAQHSLAELKARGRMRNREDERAWKDIREGFNAAWKNLEDAFDQASHERA